MIKIPKGCKLANGFTMDEIPSSWIFVAYDNNKQFSDACEWCYNKCYSFWTTSQQFSDMFFDDKGFYFEDEDDALDFELRWI